MMQNSAVQTEEIQRAVREEVGKSIKALNFKEIHRKYWEQEESIILDQFLPTSVVEKYFLPECEQLRPYIHRNYIPKHKKGGSVSYFVMKEEAPAFMAFYRSPEFLNFLIHIVQAPLVYCPENDPHSCALYFYTEAGDHIGYHYDTSYYKGARYTVLMGLVQRSDHCRLVCELFKADPNRETKTIDTKTPPGSMVLFNGDKLWHSITPLGEGEERIVLTMEYVTIAGVTGSDPGMG